jgi:hypothetical protein
MKTNFRSREEIAQSFKDAWDAYMAAGETEWGRFRYAVYQRARNHELLLDIRDLLLRTDAREQPDEVDYRGKTSFRELGLSPLREPPKTPDGNPPEPGTCPTCSYSRESLEGKPRTYRCYCPHKPEILVPSKDPFVGYQEHGPLEYPADYGCRFHEPASETK